LAQTAGEAVRPAMREAGFTPGVAKKIRKTSTLMVNITKIADASRFAMKRSIYIDRAICSGIERVANAVTEDIEGDTRDHDADAGPMATHGRV